LLFSIVGSFYKETFFYLFSPNSHPLLYILNLREAWVSVFPEVDECLIILYGLSLPAFLLGKLAQHVEALGADFLSIRPAKER